MNTKDFFAEGTNVQAAMLRATQQYLLPIEKPHGPAGRYDIYPALAVDGVIHAGYDGLAMHIAGQGKNWVLEGYSGVYWDILIHELTERLIREGLDANWIPVSAALKTDAEIRSLIAPSMGGNDPLFGKIYEGTLADFFDAERLMALKPVADKVNILYGPGAALAGWDAAVGYVEVPKNEIQFRSRQGSICNLGDRQPTDAKMQYKRFYFVEWPVLNRHKEQILASLELVIDEQRIEEITWCTGKTVREGLDKMSRQMFRARPWFEPGVWGGQWIKDRIPGINGEVQNYAWSFELIAPENGVLLEQDGRLLEISFDTLLMHNSQAVLGKAARRFGKTFPIRFDFLDTFAGGNLSLQCHPTVAYTKAHFGEPFTQDETYYILDSGEQAEVYLGFKADIDKDRFREVLDDSFRNQVPVPVKEYVQTFPSAKHDLFLIPNGTVHCSGVNNLVLEISATPYIYTFKMYDWLRPDLNGNPRTLNIDRAFENLNFERKGTVVTDTLISRQTVIEQGPDWRLLDLGTHPEHFYRIERVEFDNTIALETRGQCHVLNLVEGESITVQTDGREQVIHYAETFLVPAAAGRYVLVNRGGGRAKVIRAYVKDEYCV